VQIRSLRARAGLFACAVAITGLLVAVPSAGAATFSGGTATLKFTFPKSTKTKGKFGEAFDVQGDFGGITFNKQASGIMNFTGTVTFTSGKKKFTLSTFQLKLESGKGTLSALVGSKRLTLFNVATENKIGPDAGFTQLILKTAKLTLNKAGAAQFNKINKGKFKAKASVGQMSFVADRQLKVLSGQSDVIYDQPFYDRLQDCGITLLAIAPATAIERSDAGAPRGGARLPVSSGTLKASDLKGTIGHGGGTRLEREASHPKGAYRSDLLDFRFSLADNPPALIANVVSLNNPSVPIGILDGPPATSTLTDTGGVVNLNVALRLSGLAAGTLSQPNQANCEIPAGSSIGQTNVVANVE